MVLLGDPLLLLRLFFFEGEKSEALGDSGTSEEFFLLDFLPLAFLESEEFEGGALTCVEAIGMGSTKSISSSGVFSLAGLLSKDWLPEAFFSFIEACLDRVSLFSCFGVGLGLLRGF